MRWVLILLISLILSGCMLPAEQVSLKPETVEEQEALYTLKLTYHEQQKFMGILVVHRRPQSLHFSVLDSSGITLLQGTHTQGGQKQWRVAHLTGPLRKTRISSFLELALERIFLVQPVKNSCSGSLFSRICHRAREEEEAYDQSVGPIPIWRVTKSSLQERKLYYSQLMLDMSLTLTPIAQETIDG